MNSLGEDAAAMLSSFTGGDDDEKESGGGGGGQMSTEQYEATKPDELKKDIRMISGCHDKQTSADVSNVSSFQLPDPAGKFGSSSSMLSISLFFCTYHIMLCTTICGLQLPITLMT